MVSYSDQFVRFLPVLLAVMIFIGLGMLTIWAAKQERRAERIFNIEAEAGKVFGSEQGKALDGAGERALECVPITMLDSAQGDAEVRKSLATISHGGVV